jgi:hypothetical protein
MRVVNGLPPLKRLFMAQATGDAGLAAGMGVY